MNFNKLIPELSVSNIETSLKFYQTLGFKIMYERKEDKFYFLEFEGNQIMIEQVNDNWNVGELVYPFGRGINISMSINNVEHYYTKIVNSGIKIFRKLEKSKYRVNDVLYEDIEFLVQDPDGYLLRFNN